MFVRPSDSVRYSPFCLRGLLTTYKGNAIIIYMKDKQMIVLVDDEFLEKVDYIQRINDYKSKSETIRKTVEKEYRREVIDASTKNKR